MNRIYLLIVFLSLKVTSFSNDCTWQGSFLNICEFGEVDYIVLGKVIDYDVFQKGIYTDKLYPTVMEMEIIEILMPIKGGLTIENFDKYSKKKIRIIGNTSNKTRPFIEEFPMNSSWVIALYDYNKHIMFNDYNIDYSVSNCGTYFLKFENGSIKGNIEGTNQKLSGDAKNIELKYKDFKIKLEKILELKK